MSQEQGVYAVCARLLGPAVPKAEAFDTVAGQLAFRGMGEVRLDKGVYVVVVDGKAQKVML